VAYVGTAAALLGAGTASAAAVVTAAHAPAAASASALSPASQHAVKHAASAAGGHKALAAAPARHAVTRVASVRTAAAHGTQAKKVTVRAPKKARAASWTQVVKTVAKTSPGTPAAADELQPVAPSGPQTWMPISGSQLANATTIVKQAYAKQMGVRSAVIAVATSMQESTLTNINYGDRDSLGLFQQRPSCGWGTAQQILTPKYAADAFLTALHQHQAGDPGWAKQPLWANAQAVQASGFPTAYAKWEAQAAHLVKQITTQLR
jgi:hypothetical protein